MAEKTRCEICDRTFKDADGLAAHNKAKHPEKIPKERKHSQRKKTFVYQENKKLYDFYHYHWFNCLGHYDFNI